MVTFNFPHQSLVSSSNGLTGLSFIPVLPEFPNTLGRQTQNTPVGLQPNSLNLESTTVNPATPVRACLTDSRKSWKRNGCSEGECCFLLWMATGKGGPGSQGPFLNHFQLHLDSSCRFGIHLWVTMHSEIFSDGHIS